MDGGSMKKTIFAVVGLFISLLIIHLLIWPLNKSLTSKLQDQRKTAKEFVMIKDQRLLLEAAQKKEINEYKWIDQRKEYAKIPLERAFDYYLRHSQP